MIKIIVGTAKNFTMGSRVDDKINDERFKIMEDNNIDISILFNKYNESNSIVGGIYQKNSMLKTDNKNIYVLSKDKNIDVEDNIQVIDDYMYLVNKYKDSKDVLSVVGGKIVFDLFTPYANEIFVMEPTINLPGELIYDSYIDESMFELVEVIKGNNVEFKTYKRVS